MKLKWSCAVALIAFALAFASAVPMPARAVTASRLALSLVPWTGPELPGSIPDTRKFRLAVIGTPHAAVALAAAGVPKTWVASFCSDRVCSPNRLIVTLPGSGVKIIEFQLIPPESRARTPKVSVSAREGVRWARATT